MILKINSCTVYAFWYPMCVRARIACRPVFMIAILLSSLEAYSDSVQSQRSHTVKTLWTIKGAPYQHSQNEMNEHNNKAKGG